MDYDPAAISDKYLDSPPIRIVLPTNAFLHFQNNYSAGRHPRRRVLEVSIEAGHFKTSWLQVVPLVSAVTMVQSAVAAAIRWLVAKRDRHSGGFITRLWTCISPGGIPSAAMAHRQR